MTTDEEKAIRKQDKIASKTLNGTSKLLQNIAKNSLNKAEQSENAGKKKVTVLEDAAQNDEKININENTASNREKISISEGTDTAKGIPPKNSAEESAGTHVSYKENNSAYNSKVNIQGETSPQINIQRNIKNNAPAKQAFHQAETMVENGQTPNNTGYVPGHVPKGLSGAHSLSQKSDVQNSARNGLKDAGSKYKNADIDMTAIANAKLASSQQKWQKSDKADISGKVHQYEDAAGIGEIAGVQNAVNDYAKKNGSKARYKNFSTEVSHSKIVDTFNNNERLVDAYLLGHGIDTRNMTVTDIDNMLSKVSITNDSMSNNGHKTSSWNGGSSGSRTMDSEMKNVLLEKRAMIEMSPKIKQIENSKISARASGKLPDNIIDTMEQNMEGSDMEHAASGYQNVKSVVRSARAGTVAAEGITTGVGKAVVRSIEATGRITSSGAKGAINLGGKIYARGDAEKAAKWSTKTENVNVNLNKMNDISKKIGHEGSKYINKGLKASVGFTSRTAFQKARIIDGGIKSGVNKAGKWAVRSISKTATGKKVIDKVSNSKLGAMQKKIADYIKKNRLKKLSKKKLKENRHNALHGITKKFAKIAAGGVLILCLFVVTTLTPVLLVSSIFPDIYPADDSAEISKNVADKAIEAMLDVQSDFLTEVATYFDETCTVVDEDGNKIHVPHTAYYVSYFGSMNNEYEDLLSNNRITGAQSIMILYKTIISMATVATGNESEDADFYVRYCTNLLKKILHNSTFIDEDGVVAIHINDASLIDGMKLDAQDKYCLLNPGCGGFFPKTDDAWMHTYGDDSLEYSTWLRSSSNYNKWEGWITDDQKSFDWAKTLYDMEAEDWDELHIELPNMDGGGTGVSISSEEVATILDGVSSQLSGSDSPQRLAVIERALYENNRLHVYSWGGGHQKFNEGEDLPVGLDCSGFVFGVLQTAGVVNGPGNTATAAGFPDADVLRPGDIILKYHNNNGQDHIILYLGETQYGPFTTIECTTRTSNITHTKISGVQMNVYNDLADFQRKRGAVYDKFKNPYGD